MLAIPSLEFDRLDRTEQAAARSDWRRLSQPMRDSLQRHEYRRKRSAMAEFEGRKKIQPFR